METDLEYNEKEKEALVLFRQQVENFCTDLADHFLIRWLRARNLDLKKSKEMLQNYYEWKSTNPFLADLANWTPPAVISDDFKYKFLGYDDAQRPVLWMPIGRWEVRLRLEEGLKADCFRYTYTIMQEIMDALDQQRVKAGATQFVVIIDSAELSLRKISIETMQCVLRFFREFEAYYPETISACYVVNAPWVFSIVFNLVKPLMSGRTLAKLQVFDFNAEKWKPVLSSVIPAGVLPEEYGGDAVRVLA